MKKLKLSLSNLDGVQMLTKEQMKKVIGGDAPGGGSGQCNSGAGYCYTGLYCYVTCGGQETQGSCGVMSNYGNCNCVGVC